VRAVATTALNRVPRADYRFAIVTAVAVVVCGVGVTLHPLVLVALLGAALLVGLALIPPVAHLVLLMGVTAIVPYGVQNSLGIGGGSGSPGLLLSDALLLSGLLRVGPWLLTRHVPRRLRLGAVLITAFVAVAVLQLVHGMAAGRNASRVGAEFRVLLGFASFLVAIPVLCDDVQRRRFVRALPWLGLLMGLWGMAQWVFDLQFSAAKDAGVQEGIRFTTSGRGQLQGGLFGYPVATVMALAALMSDEIRSLRGRLLLVAVLVLNALCLVFTYERTFWVATTFAAGVVVLKAGGIQRFRAVVWGTAVALVGFAVLTTMAPGELTAARERLLSLSQYGSDDSVRYRLAESGHVVNEIRARPVTGSGLGATIFFGRPWDRVPPESLAFAHNGYLWLAWKVGIPGALLLFSVLFWSIGWLRRPADGSAMETVRNGASGALLALALGSVTFPSFNQLGITAVMGALMAAALVPRPVAASP
jgi:hypothetical protein